MFGTVNISIKNRLKSIIQFSGLASMLALSSCGGNSDPCEWYPEETVKMEVIEIEKIDDNQYEVWMEFNKSILAKEPQRLSELRGHTIDLDFITTNQISENIIIEGVVTELKKGNCEPYYVSYHFGFKNPK